MFIMKIISILINVFLSSATPNLFGSRKRRKEKEAAAEAYQNKIRIGYAETQAELDKELGELKVQNPFENAAAKSAMAAASRKAKQTRQRFANIIGGNTNPEAIIAAQQATQEAVAGTAGDIAVGAEASKQARLDQLGREKRQARNIYAQQEAQGEMMKTAAINERGQGWKDFFSSIGPVTQGISWAAGGAGASLGGS